MFHTFRDLKGVAVRASDEPKGTVDDFFFDDEDWRVRYLVAGIGFWLVGRQCLISAELLQSPDLRTRQLPVLITAGEMSEAPRPEDEPPVSMQEEGARTPEAGYWPPFLVGAVGMGYTPVLADAQIRAAIPSAAGDTADVRPSGDPHLRSMSELIGYEIAATDGRIGSVSDLLINPLDWRVKYIVIDTGGWLPGREVILAPNWTSSIDWASRSWIVDVTKRQVENSPETRNVAGLQRSDEQAIYDHYGAPPYW